MSRDPVWTSGQHRLGHWPLFRLGALIAGWKKQKGKKAQNDAVGHRARARTDVARGIGGGPPDSRMAAAPQRQVTRPAVTCAGYARVSPGRLDGASPNATTALMAGATGDAFAVQWPAHSTRGLRPRVDISSGPAVGVVPTWRSRTPRPGSVASSSPPSDSAAMTSWSTSCQPWRPQSRPPRAGRRRPRDRHPVALEVRLLQPLGTSRDRGADRPARPQVPHQDTNASRELTPTAHRGTGAPPEPGAVAAATHGRGRVAAVTGIQQPVTALGSATGVRHSRRGHDVRRVFRRVMPRWCRPDPCPSLASPVEELLPVLSRAEDR